MTRADRLDPILHVRGAMLWLNWKHAAEAFGFAGSRAPVNENPRSDASWVGGERVEARVGRL